MDFLSVFQTAAGQASQLLDTAKETAGDIGKIFSAGSPTPAPAPAPAPTPVEEEVFVTEAQDGALDRLADSLGLSRGAVKWTVYGGVAVLLAFIVSRLFFRGK